MSHNTHVVWATVIGVAIVFFAIAPGQDVRPAIYSMCLNEDKSNAAECTKALFDNNSEVVIK